MNDKKDYDNLVGSQVVSNPLQGLADKNDQFDKEWKKHWKEMPEFEQEENKPFKTIYLHFRNEKDYKEFAKLVDQKLTDKTKSAWYPKLEITKNSLLRWMEDD